MKIRTGFVSNSSSSSFVVDLSCDSLSFDNLMKIFFPNKLEDDIVYLDSKAIKIAIIIQELIKSCKKQKLSFIELLKFLSQKQDFAYATIGQSEALTERQIDEAFYDIFKHNVLDKAIELWQKKSGNFYLFELSNNENEIKKELFYGFENLLRELALIYDAIKTIGE